MRHLLSFVFTGVAVAAFVSVILRSHHQQIALITPEVRLFRDRNFSLQLPPSLSTSKVPILGQATVFYVWCGVSRRQFEFRNYLSVRSALRILRPDNIWFYYESEPIIDHALYNTWWKELINDVPFFHRRSLRHIRLPQKACNGSGRPSVDFVCSLVTSRGGTFIDESTVVVARPPDDGVTVATDSRDKLDVRLQLLKANRGVTCPFRGNQRESTRKVRWLECSFSSQLSSDALCIQTSQSLYPKDIWTLDTDIGRLLRREFYGRPDIITSPLPDFAHLAPNIGHVIWVGGGKMDFLFFLCVLSLLHVVKVDIVYLHGDRAPTGIYWDLLISTRQNIHIVYRENSKEVGT